MFSSDTYRGGFATIAIIGGTVVAAAVGGVFYFLRSAPVEIDTTLTDDSVALIGAGSELSVDAEQVLLRSLPRSQGLDYCSLLGLDRDSCASGVADACRDLFGSCSVDLREDTTEDLRLLAEACLVLMNSDSRDMYFSWLDSDDPGPFPLYYAIFGLSSDTFSQEDLSGRYQALLRSDFSTSDCDNRDAPRLLTEGYLVLSDAGGRDAYDVWLADDSGKPFSLHSVFLGLSGGAFDQEGADGAYRAFLDRYFSGFYGDNEEALQMVTEAYSGILDSFDASFSSSDLGILAVDLNLSSSDLGALIGNLNLPTSDIGALIGNLNLPTSDIGALIGNLNLPTSDIGALIGNLNLPTSDIGALIGNLNLPTSDIAALVGDLNLPAVDLDALINTFTPPPVDLNTIPRSGGSFEGITPPSDADSGDLSLPVVSISAYPRYGQIGVLSDIEPSFRLTITQVPDTPISVVLECSQSVDDGQQSASLISGTLPSSISLSDSDSVTVVDLKRNPGVTGSATCIVVVGASAAYAIGSSNSATITVVDGSSPAVVDRSSDDLLPIASVTVPVRSVDSGEDAVFRVSTDRDILLPLRVRYSCAITPGVAVHNQDSVTITGDSDGRFEEVRIQTKVGSSGYVRCSLEDDVSNYTVRGRTASVAVGLLRSDDATGTSAVGGFDPTLPTVSLIAYRTESGDSDTFSRSVSSALVGDENTYFGLVIDDPGVGETTPFGEEISRIEVPNGSLYALSLTDFGRTISVLSNPAGSQVINVVITSDVEVPDIPLALSGSGPPILTPPNGYSSADLSTQLRQYPWRNVVEYAGSRISIEIQRDAAQGDRVVMRKSTGETVVCGYDGGTMSCVTYRGEFSRESIQVTARCYKDFSDDRDREISDVFVGGRYYDTSVPGFYAVRVNDYAADRDDPRGELYQFFFPDGGYVSAEEGREGLISSDLDPFFEPGVSFSCEIVGGGAEDGYNVGTRQAEVQVYPKPAVSIESGRSVGVGDADPLGAPVATVPYGTREYKFSDQSGSSFLDRVDAGLFNDSIEVLDSGASFSAAAGGFLQSVGVGFLTSFGSCVAANVLNSGLGAIADIGVFGLGKSKVGIEDESSDSKECYLDVAATEAAMGVLTAITRDYIVWANEGFEDKPLFVRNPTTFYNNLRDDIIGHVIDRSGLGFLCNIGFGEFDPSLTARIKFDLEQQYFGLDTAQPRCTYSDLRNNLEEFYADASFSLSDFNPDDLVDLGFSVTADPQYGGTKLLSPQLPGSGNQLDELSANLERTLNRVQNSQNILLSLVELDDEVSQAERDFEASAKPGVQVFNSSDPTSVAAFKECTEAENPEGNPDCFLLNVSGQRITAATNKALDISLDRLLQVDEYGEIGQLVKLAANATSAGLMRKYLRNGFGVTVARETVDILTDISESSLLSSSPYGSRKIGLGGLWWSAFFQNNGFYERVLESELYAADIFTLLQYLDLSFYEEDVGEARGFPPTTPYNDFYTIHSNQKTCGGFGPCKEGYPFFRNSSHGDLAGHFNLVINSSDPLNNNASWREGETHNTLNEVFPNSKRKYRAEALERFRDAYRFLADPTRRQRYHAFIETLNPYTINPRPVNPLAVSLYRNYPDTTAVTKYPQKWHRVAFPGALLPRLDGFALPKSLRPLEEKTSILLNSQVGSLPGARYPQDLDALKESVFGYSASPRSFACFGDGEFNDFAYCAITREFVHRASGVITTKTTLFECVDRRSPTATGCVYCIENECEKYYRCTLSDIHQPPLSREYPSAAWDHLSDVKASLKESIYSDTTCNTDTVIAQSRDNLDVIGALREIYEATILAHIHFVGLVDEYSNHSQTISSPVHKYRSDILSGKDHSSALERWQLVRDATFDKFRDGTMQVYLPLEKGEAKKEHRAALAGCSDSGRVVSIRHPTTYREYQGTNCVLGTVFQDQAYFVVRRRQSDFPELLSRSLDIDLACGYAGIEDSRDERYQFARIERNLLRRPITLESNQDAVLFPVPKFRDIFDLSDPNERERRRDEIRCSIVSVQYTDGSDALDDFDEGALTAVVEVSDISSRSGTLHSKVNTALSGQGVPEKRDNRINQIGAALFYVYVWGWFTGFIDMPYYSIQGLLSNPPFGISDGVNEFTDITLQNQEFLQRYRLLASLFVDESDERFSAEHFGFLTAQQAFDRYKDGYKSRFDASFGRSLGDFLQELPPQYRQQ